MTEKMEKTSITDTDFISHAEKEFGLWRDDLESLEDMVKGAGETLEQAYDEQITTLKRYLHDFEEQLDELKLADSNQWDQQKSNVQQAARNYQQAYGEAMKHMRTAESQPAGWLEGFADHPPTGSAGWLEGTGAHAEGSLGWVKGMAPEKTLATEGWTEGYSHEEKHPTN